MEKFDGTPTLIEQAGKGQTKIGRPTSQEQAGKGAAGNWTPHKCGPERAPAGLSTLTLKVSNGDSAGAHSGLNLQRVQVSAAPFPACSTH